LGVFLSPFGIGTKQTSAAIFIAAPPSNRTPRRFTRGDAGGPGRSTSPGAFPCPRARPTALLLRGRQQQTEHPTMAHGALLYSSISASEQARRAGAGRSAWRGVHSLQRGERSAANARKRLYFARGSAVNINKRYIPSLSVPSSTLSCASWKEKWFRVLPSALRDAGSPEDHEALPNGVLAGCRDL
jgi:hypothetical protein